MRRISLINCHSVKLRISGPSSRPLWTIQIFARSPHLSDGFNRYILKLHRSNNFHMLSTGLQTPILLDKFFLWWVSDLIDGQLLITASVLIHPHRTIGPLLHPPSSTFTAQWYRLVNPPLAGLILQQANSEGREDSILQLNPSSSCFNFTAFCFYSPKSFFLSTHAQGSCSPAPWTLHPLLCYK